VSLPSSFFHFSMVLQVVVTVVPASSTKVR
jgi:hypothetical protein